MRRTSHKVPPKPETLATIQDSKIWKMENEFYQFVRKQFRFVKSQTFQQVKGQFIEKSNRFHYEKIRPRWGIIFAVNKIWFENILLHRSYCKRTRHKFWQTLNAFSCIKIYRPSFCYVIMVLQFLIFFFWLYCF